MPKSWLDAMFLTLISSHLLLLSQPAVSPVIHLLIHSLLFPVLIIWKCLLNSRLCTYIRNKPHWYPMVSFKKQVKKHHISNCVHSCLLKKFITKVFSHRVNVMNMCVFLIHYEKSGVIHRFLKELYLPNL